jgi:hypothetical protein
MYLSKTASIFIFLPLLVFACSSTQEIRKPPQLAYEEPILSKEIDDRDTEGVPVNPTTTFSTEDPEVIASLKLKNLSGSHTLRYDWHDPDGNLYSTTDNQPLKAAKGKYLREATSWHSLSIQGEKPAHKPGHWKVQVYLDKDLIASKAFTIEPRIIDVDTEIPETAMRNPDGIALIIGNRNYEHPDVPAVTYAHNDAEIMKKYLIKTLGYREDNILFETDATKAKLEELLGTTDNHRGDLYTYVKPNKSDVFIYYSGHGAPDPNTKQGYFVPVNCPPAKAALVGYSLNTFYKNLSKLDAKSITVVIDSCFSGGTSTGKMLISSASPVWIKVENPAIAKRDTVILTSSQGDQISSWYDENKHGLFTYFFLKALNGSADRNGDKKITFQEIYEFIADKAEGVPYWAKRLHSGRIQTPTLQGMNKNKVFLEY